MSEVSERGPSRTIQLPQECTFIQRASCCPAYQSLSQDPAKPFHRRGQPDVNLPLLSHSVPSFITHLTFIPAQVQVDTPVLHVPHISAEQQPWTLSGWCSYSALLGKHPPIAVAGILNYRNFQIALQLHTATRQSLHLVQLGSPLDPICSTAAHSHSNSSGCAWTQLEPRNLQVSSESRYYIVFWWRSQAFGWT